MTVNRSVLRRQSAATIPARAAKLLLASCMVVVLAGCGGQRTSPVNGVVLLDGKPLAGASIQFVPQGTGRDATGQTDASGEFSMSTFNPKDGVMPGEYKVVISPPAATPDKTPYASAEEAMAAAAKARPKKVTSDLPVKYSQPDQTPLTQTVPVKENLKFDLKSK